jgi:hypothetical protein
VIDLAPWRERLGQAITDVPVMLAADADTIDDEGRTAPGIHLIPGRDRPRTAGVVPGNAHKFECDVLVLFVLLRGNSATGAELIDDLRLQREAVARALIDWQPDDADEEIQPRGGDIFRFSQSALTWIDVYQTAFWWGNQQS